MTQTVHSQIGASSMHRWAQCPGSVRLCAQMPPSSSSYAEEGTKAHEVASTFLETGKWIKCDSEMQEAVRLYTDHVLTIVHAAKTFGRKTGFFIEHSFDLSALHPGLYGTADCVVFDEASKTLHVIDYKHGAGVPVEVEGNEQLLYYGLGALISLKLPVNTVSLTIVQPRCSHPDGPIRSTSLDVMELLDFGMDLVEAAKRTEDSSAPLVPGPDQCRFCVAKPICPALHKNAQEIAKSEFSDIATVVPDAYDPKSLGETLEKIDVLEGWIKALRAFAYSEAERGKVIPGWKLVAKRVTRKWADPVAASEFFQSEFPNVTDVFEAPSLKSPAQVEKILHERQHEKIAPLIVSVSSGNTLVPASDKRQEVKMLDAKSEFGLLDLLS